MKPSTTRNFSILFVLILILERVSNSVESLSNLYYIAKPALVLSLLIFFLKNSSHLHKKTKNLTVLALVFCIIGDSLLMFQNTSPKYFIGGLAAFLIGHIFYCLLFNTKRGKQKNTLIFIFGLLVYASALFYLFKDGLGNMLIPVSLYILVILTMATMAFLRKNIVPKESYNLVLIGAIFFMLSDSTLAINKFYKPFELSGHIIMITYALAQYLIVLGILKQRN